MVKVYLDRNGSKEDLPDYKYELHFKRATYEEYDDFGKRDRSLDSTKWLRVTQLDHYLLSEVKEELRKNKIALYEETTKNNQTYKEIYDVIEPQRNFVVERILGMHIGLEYIRKLPLFEHNLDPKQLTIEQIEKLPTRLPKTTYRAVQQVRLNCNIDTVGIFTIIPDVLPQAQPVSFSHLFALGLQKFVLDKDFSFARMQRSGLKRDVKRMEEEIESIADRLNAVVGSETAPVEFIREYKEAGAPIVFDENFRDRVWEKDLKPGDVRAAIARFIEAGELVQVSEAPEMYRWIEEISQKDKFRVRSEQI